MNDTIIDKVRKLLRLATSSNANEAALAAARAQEMIDKHHLEQAMLSLDSAEPVRGLDDEPILDFYREGAPLDTPKQLDRWRVWLAGALAQYNASRIYLSGRNISIVGRPSDVETVRYIYTHLSREVERLATENGAGMGRTWRNNFRLGVVDAIKTKLRNQHAQFEHDAREVAAAESSTALVRVNTALVTMSERTQAVDKWMKSNLKLHAGSASYSRHDASARDRGRKAGASLSVGGDRAQLGAGRKGISS